MDHVGRVAVRALRPVVPLLVALVAVEAAREDQDEAQDVIGDVIRVDAGRVRHHGRVGLQRREHVALLANVRGLDPAETSRGGQHVGGHGPIERVGIDDLAPARLAVGRDHELGVRGNRPQASEQGRLGPAFGTLRRQYKLHERLPASRSITVT